VKAGTGARAGDPPVPASRPLHVIDPAWAILNHAAQRKVLCPKKLRTRWADFDSLRIWPVAASLSCAVLRAGSWRVTA